MSTSSAGLSLLFPADGFLSMVAFIGGNSGIGTFSTVSSILDEYDGMLAGMELKRRSD